MGKFDGRRRCGRVAMDSTVMALCDFEIASG